MVDVQIERVKELYEELQANTIQWLQSYTGKPIENLELLLLDEMVLKMDRTTLNYMFKSLEAVAPEVEITLYSVQSDINERQTFHLEVKQRNSDFCFNTPLHSLLSPEHKTDSDVIPFFKYLFIQIAALQFASEQQREITSTYIDEILNHFYEKSNEQESIKEEPSMEFRIKGETAVSTEESEWETRYTDHVEEKLDNEEEFNFDLDEEELDEEELDEVDLDDEDFFEEEREDEVAAEVFSDDVAEEESLLDENPLAIDFDILNQNINEIFKLAAPSDRDQLKHLKADVWELEMSVEENGLSSDDVQGLAYTILELDGSDAVVMKWQISTAKQLLNLIVKR